MADPIPTSLDTIYEREITIEADTATLQRQRKEGHSRGFTVYGDESGRIEWDGL